jgi:HK97 gp10 family phage protein
MSGKVTISITGLEDCEAKLKSLSERVAKRKIGTALKDAAAYLVVRIERNTYVGKDHPAHRLKNSFIASNVRDRYPTYEVDIGPVKSKTATAMAQELGFPTTPAHPAMVPTLDKEKDTILRIFTDALNEELENIKL